MGNKFNLDKVMANLKQVDMSLDLANVAKNDFLENFKQQGFDGIHWKEVQRRVKDTDAWKYPLKYNMGRRTRNILQGKGSGRLRRDVANSVARGKKNSKWSYTLVVANPYAGFHNEGTNKLARRRFVGMTRRLNEMLLRKIKQKIDSAWKV